MKHTFEVRGDTLHMVIRGAFDEDAMAEAERKYSRVIEQHPYYFVIADCSAMTGLPAETRGRAGRLRLADRCGGNAIYGAGFLVRTLITMVARAMVLFRRLPVPVAFVANEQEAWDWVARRKKELGIPAVSPPSHIAPYLSSDKQKPV